MKSNFPIVSQEIKNVIFQGYENLVYLLGFEADGYSHFSGLYEYISSSGDYLMISESGIPNLNMSKIITMLKFDYFYRKNWGCIKYKEIYNV
jgi:hypothetical protein